MRNISIEIRVSRRSGNGYDTFGYILIRKGQVPTYAKYPIPGVRTSILVDPETASEYNGIHESPTRHRDMVAQLVGQRTDDEE